MKTAIPVFFALLFALPLSAQVKHQSDRKSLIDRDPDVVHLADYVKEPIRLKVVKPATVFTDKSGKNRMGTLVADQTVVLEAMTERAYKVRGAGENTRNGVAGWVSPQSFSSKDPDFVENLKKFYRRQIEVAALIDQGQVAVGMTEDEVSQVLGKPTKTQMKQTAKGQSGRWEFIDYQDISHYQYVRDPYTGQVFRQLAYVTREEKDKTVVEFEGGVVSSLEESKQRRRSPAKIILPPVAFLW